MAVKITITLHTFPSGRQALAVHSKDVAAGLGILHGEVIRVARQTFGNVTAKAFADDHVDIVQGNGSRARCVFFSDAGAGEFLKAFARRRGHRAEAIEKLKGFLAGAFLDSAKSVAGAAAVRPDADTQLRAQALPVDEAAGETAEPATGDATGDIPEGPARDNAGDAAGEELDPGPDKSADGSGMGEALKTWLGKVLAMEQAKSEFEEASAAAKAKLRAAIAAREACEGRGEDGEDDDDGKAEEAAASAARVMRDRWTEVARRLSHGRHGRTLAVSSVRVNEVRELADLLEAKGFSPEKAAIYAVDRVYGWQRQWR